MKKKSKIVGYGYRLSSETLHNALLNYIGQGEFNFHTTEKAVVKGVYYDKKEGFIGPTSKPKYFKVTVEEVEVQE